MNRRPALLLVACLLATGCSDDPTLTGSSGSTSPTTRSTEAAAPAPTTAAPSPTASAAEQEPPFEADTGRDEQDASGGPLAVTVVRVGGHDGYDRVVFELDGRDPGVPGWQVEYVDDPRQDGSGDPVAVEGEATLSVRISGVGYPMDTGVEEQPKEPAVPERLPAVEDVVIGSVFEGVFEAFVGVSGKQPFRVFRLADPARVVVDVRHG